MLNKKIFLLVIFIACLLIVLPVSANENSTDNTKDASASADGNVMQVTLKPVKLSTTYSSGKYFKVKAVDSKTKKPVPKVKVNLKVFTGKKYKKTTITTDSKGVAKYSASYLKVGKHKVIVSSKQYKAKAKSSSIKISQALKLDLVIVNEILSLNG